MNNSKVKVSEIRIDQTKEGWSIFRKNIQIGSIQPIHPICQLCKGSGILDDIFDEKGMLLVDGDCPRCNGEGVKHLFQAKRWGYQYSFDVKFTSLNNCFKLFEDSSPKKLA